MSVFVTKRNADIQFNWEHDHCTITYNLGLHMDFGGRGLVPVLPFEARIDYERVADAMIEAYGKRVKSDVRTTLVNDLRKTGPYSLIIDA